MIDVSIIILSYNGKELLGQTLDSVHDCYGQGLEIETIVTDNGSVDGSIELVKEKYPWVTLVENGANLGFSAGNNRGVPAAHGKYVLFLNSDTKLYSDVLPFLLKKFETDSGLGVATCRVELKDGSIDPACHRGFPTPWRAFCYYSKLEKLASTISIGAIRRPLVTWFGGYHLLGKDTTVEHEIDSCTGAFLLISHELGDRIKWWDEAYFMYGEDLDFCYKVKELGYSVKYFPEVKILHLKHQSGLKRDSNNQKKETDSLADEEKKQIKRKTMTAFYDAMKIFYHKHFVSKYPRVITFLVLWFVEYKKRKALSRI